MNGSGAAKRFPRERFNRTLARLFTRLDAQAPAQFDVCSRRGAIVTFSGRVEARVKRLWAVGSFARGAALCLDCDLVVEGEASWVGAPTVNGRVDPDWPAPPELHLYRTQLLGSWPHVHILSRWDAEHSKVRDEATGALRPPFSMPDAVLLYGDGVNWAEALASIKVDPAAGHYPRAHDALPLRLEQTGMQLVDAEKLLEARAAGKISWHYVPLVERIPPDSPLLNAGEREYLQYLQRLRGGKKTMEVAGAALLVTREFRGSRPCALEAAGDYRGPYSKNLVVYRFGKPSVHLRGFSASGPYGFILVPHWSQTGPNRAWILTRSSASRTR